MPFYVYILRCRNDSYYIGFTSDLKARLASHNRGEAAAWTRKHRPVTLVYHEAYDTELEASRRERQLKGWSRAKKTALITGDKDHLHTLSRRRKQAK